MAKYNIKLAFHLLPVYPLDFEIPSFAFEGQFYMDRAVPMGCSVSCAAFERFSTFLEWALQHHTGLMDIVHYMNDFLFPGMTCLFVFKT